MDGATVTLNVNYLAAARGQDLTAHAIVTQRGGRLVFSEVRVTEPTGGWSRPARSSSGWGRTE